MNITFNQNTSYGFVVGSTISKYNLKVISKITCSKLETEKSAQFALFASMIPLLAGKHFKENQESSFLDMKLNELSIKDLIDKLNSLYNDNVIVETSHIAKDPSAIALSKDNKSAVIIEANAPLCDEVLDFLSILAHDILATRPIALLPDQIENDDIEYQYKITHDPIKLEKWKNESCLLSKNDNQFLKIKNKLEQEVGSVQLTTVRILSI